MTNRIAILITLLTALLVCGFTVSPVHASDSDSFTTLTLKSTVRLAADNDTLTFADIASIVGPQAQIVKSLPIDPQEAIEAGQWTSIEISTLRSLLDLTPSINAGSVIIVGSDLSITRRRASTNTPNQPLTTFKKETYEGPILKDHIERWILTRLRTQADTTRIRFEQRDEKTIALPTADRVVEITQTGRSTKMHLRIIVYENDRIVTQSSMRVDVQIQRSVRVASGQIRRRDRINIDSSTIETRWLSPILPIADPEKSIGLECKTLIHPGEIILSTMLAQPVLVKRGQLVSAKSLVGRAIVTKVVRALESGQMGDLIELESKDRSSNFTARIAGPGKVIIIQNAPKTPENSSE